jgi:NitT/TauT family transport system substrate-binding protein
MIKSSSIKAFMGVLAASTMLGLPVATFAQAPAKTTIRSAYIPAATWLPAWVAKDTGIFERHGLDVSLAVIQNIGLLPGTVGKQFDIAPATPPDLINAAAKGLNVVGVAGGWVETASRRSVEIIVRKDSGIAGPQDLKGKLIASVALGSLIHVSTLYWLKQSGVDPNTIRAVEVPFPNMPDQLKAGRLDAVEVIEPFVTPLLAAGNVSIGDPILKVADPTHGTLWIAEADWARANPGVLKNWIASLTEAADYIKTNPEPSRAILGKYTRLPEPVVKTIPIPEYNAILEPKSLEPWIRVLTELGQVTKPLDAATLVVRAE